MKYSFRFVIVAGLFIVCLLTANIVGVKFASFGFVSLPAAVILFPFSYIFGDVLTEVYGYKTARKVIWLGFGCNLIFVIFAYFAQILPPAVGWEGQQAYETIIGSTWRILAASFLGYIVGEFSNSFILARMKILTRGRWLWMRTISSTLVGEGLDTVIFLIVAYMGMPFFTPIVILYHWTAKVLIEVILTPATYRVVGYLKKKEDIDTYDYKTRFNPFLIR
ncbi:MAG: queuosine precursor transporter [Dehalococcoidales bacterium]|nr:queuosine precursor transporter [Dehalococcoidales bacterium]